MDTLSLSLCRHNPDTPDLLTTLGLLYMEVSMHTHAHTYTVCVAHSLMMKDHLLVGRDKEGI